MQFLRKAQTLHSLALEGGADQLPYARLAFLNAIRAADEGMSASDVEEARGMVPEPLLAPVLAAGAKKSKKRKPRKKKGPRDSQQQLRDEYDSLLRALTDLGTDDSLGIMDFEKDIRPLIGRAGRFLGGQGGGNDACASLESRKEEYQKLRDKLAFYTDLNNRYAAWQGGSSKHERYMRLHAVCMEAQRTLLEPRGMKAGSIDTVADLERAVDESKRHALKGNADLAQGMVLLLQRCGERVLYPDEGEYISWLNASLAKGNLADDEPKVDVVPDISGLDHAALERFLHLICHADRLVVGKPIMLPKGDATIFVQGNLEALLGGLSGEIVVNEVQDDGTFATVTHKENVKEYAYVAIPPAEPDAFIVGKAQTFPQQSSDVQKVVFPSMSAVRSDRYAGKSCTDTTLGGARAGSVVTLNGDRTGIYLGKYMLPEFDDMGMIRKDEPLRPYQFFAEPTDADDVEPEKEGPKIFHLLAGKGAAAGKWRSKDGKKYQYFCDSNNDPQCERFLGKKMPTDWSSMPFFSFNVESGRTSTIMMHDTAFSVFRIGEEPLRGGSTEEEIAALERDLQTASAWSDAECHRSNDWDALFQLYVETFEHHAKKVPGRADDMNRSLARLKGKVEECDSVNKVRKYVAEAMHTCAFDRSCDNASSAEDMACEENLRNAGMDADADELREWRESCEKERQSLDNVYEKVKASSCEDVESQDVQEYKRKIMASDFTSLRERYTNWEGRCRDELKTLQKDYASVQDLTCDDIGSEKLAKYRRDIMASNRPDLQQQYAAYEEQCLQELYNKIDWSACEITGVEKYEEALKLAGRKDDLDKLSKWKKDCMKILLDSSHTGKPTAATPKPTPVPKPKPKPVTKPTPKPVTKPTPKPVTKPTPKPVTKPKPAPKPVTPPGKLSSLAVDTRKVKMGELKKKAYSDCSADADSVKEYEGLLRESGMADELKKLEEHRQQCEKDRQMLEEVKDKSERLLESIARQRRDKLSRQRTKAKRKRDKRLRAERRQEQARHELEKFESWRVGKSCNDSASEATKMYMQRIEALDSKIHKSLQIRASLWKKRCAQYTQVRSICEHAATVPSDRQFLRTHDLGEAIRAVREAGCSGRLSISLKESDGTTKEIVEIHGPDDVYEATTPRQFVVETEDHASVLRKNLLTWTADAVSEEETIVDTGSYVWSMKGGANVQSQLSGDLMRLDDMESSLPSIHISAAPKRLFDTFW